MSFWACCRDWHVRACWACCMVGWGPRCKPSGHACQSCLQPSTQPDARMLLQHPTGSRTARTTDATQPLSMPGMGLQHVTQGP